MLGSVCTIKDLLFFGILKNFQRVWFKNTGCCFLNFVVYFGQNDKGQTDFAISRHLFTAVCARRCMLLFLESRIGAVYDFSDKKRFNRA